MLEAPQQFAALKLVEANIAVEASGRCGRCSAHKSETNGGSQVIAKEPQRLQRRCAPKPATEAVVYRQNGFAVWAQGRAAHLQGSSFFFCGKRLREIEHLVIGRGQFELTAGNWKGQACQIVFALKRSACGVPDCKPAFSRCDSPVRIRGEVRRLEALAASGKAGNALIGLGSPQPRRAIGGNGQNPGRAR